MVTQKDIQLFINDYKAFISNALKYLLYSIHQYWISVILIIALAATGSYYYWYLKPAYYETSMVCAYNNEHLSRKNYGEMFQKLDLLAQSKSANELSRLLHLPIAQTRTLIKLEAKNMSGSPLYEDITGTNQSLYFTVRTTDNKVFTPLQTAIISYLGNSDFQKNETVIEIAKLKNKMAYQQQDLFLLDSVINSYSSFLKNSISITDSLYGFSNIKILFSYKEEVEERVASLQQNISKELLPSITVVHGFTPPDYPTKGDKKIVWLGILAGIVWAVAQAVFRNTMRHD